MLTVRDSLPRSIPCTKPRSSKSDTRSPTSTRPYSSSSTPGTNTPTDRTFARQAHKQGAPRTPSRKVNHSRRGDSEARRMRSRQRHPRAIPLAHPPRRQEALLGRQPRRRAVPLGHQLRPQEAPLVRHRRWDRSPAPLVPRHLVSRPSRPRLRPLGNHQHWGARRLSCAPRKQPVPLARRVLWVPSRVHLERRHSASRRGARPLGRLPRQLPRRPQRSDSHLSPPRAGQCLGNPPSRQARLGNHRNPSAHSGKLQHWGRSPIHLVRPPDRVPLRPQPSSSSLPRTPLDNLLRRDRPRVHLGNRPPVPQPIHSDSQRRLALSAPQQPLRRPPAHSVSRSLHSSRAAPLGPPLPRAPQ